MTTVSENSTKRLEAPRPLPSGWMRQPPRGYETLRETRSWGRLREALNRHRWPFYIWGPVGTGKSFLAMTAYVRYPGQARAVRWCDFIGDAMELDRSKDGEIVRWQNGTSAEITKASFWRVAEEVELLIVDEIGTGGESDAIRGWRNEIFWRVLECRKHRPTILTGNIDPKQLGTAFDPRIQDRILEGQLFEVRGRSQRLEGLRDRMHNVE